VREECYRAFADVHALLDQAHVLSPGRYDGWDASSVGDALRDRQNAAARAQELLK
jgi:hypothetical protein